jgi:cytochrome c55X
MRCLARRVELRALCLGVWMAAVLSPAAAQPGAAPPGAAQPAAAQPAAAPPAGSQPADTQPSPEKGRQLYGSFCARCHGLNMVTSGAATFDLRTFPPDQQERFERSVKHGLRAMPAWGNILKPGDVQSLWLFVTAGR